jgi:type IV pilus assembly protein PilV
MKEISRRSREINSMDARRFPARGKVRGFTLVEALVALVVLSVGLLGVAGMQLSSLQTNGTAFQRTQATFLAEDIADRMRANRANALAGAYNFAFGTATPAVSAVTASNDINAWKGRIAAVLAPASSGVAAEQPDAAIAVDPATQIATIRIRWDDSKGRVTDLTTQNMVTFTMQTRL